MIRARLVQDRFRAMGTECAVSVSAAQPSGARTRRALAAARREVERCERALSRFMPDSDLSRVNAAAGRWTPVDERLAKALHAAERARRHTAGRYDPTILPVLAAAGYDRSFESLATREPRSLPDWRPNGGVEVDLAAMRARVQEGVAVDLGGIGKGFAAARALHAMREACPELTGGLADLGGDIAVWGDPPGGGPWRLAIADPRVPGASVGTIGLRAGAAATSGRDGRRFGPRGRLHHLIDPSTGGPAADGPLAVTVVGADAAEAEAFATALAVTPAGRAAACLSARPGLSALLVLRDEVVVIGDLPLLADPFLSEVFA